VALGDAIEQLQRQEHSSSDFVPTMNVINMLLEEGDLVQSDAEWRTTSGWADPVEHARMLHDDRRTRHYLTALSEAVGPGDVVVDIGTGSGVLAVAAARAGARHVYAIEASDIARVAERVFAINGVQDKVTLIPGWSRQIELPELADVLVAEIIGNEPLEEEILETTLDARQRLLKPDARLIPHALTLLVRPLLIPESEARQRAIGHAAIARWRGLYDIDFRPLLDAALWGPVNMPTEAEVAARWPPVGPPIPLAELHLASFEAATVGASVDLVIEPPGAVNAVAITFCASLYGGSKHTLDPWTWPTSSWATSVWVFPDRLTVVPGRKLRVHYTRRMQAKPDGISCEVVEAATVEG
jgi:precorrin-6B methylase 2